MTNGENTAFIQNREFLMSRGFAGYDGYRSDSEVFTHILHYFIAYLGLGLPCYKHGITPLSNDAIQAHPSGLAEGDGGDYAAQTPAGDI